MRFKIDENLPVDIARLLSDAGHDAQTVFDERVSGIDDLRLYEICAAEHRSLVTLDMDFADIRHYPARELIGVVVIRPKLQEKNHLIWLASRMIPTLRHEPLENHLWIIDESVIRMRRFYDQ